MGVILKFGDVCTVQYLETVRVMAVAPAQIAWGKYVRTGTWWGVVLIDREDSKPVWSTGELVTVHPAMSGFRIIESAEDLRGT